MEDMPPFIYSGIRMYIAALSLLTVVYFAHLFSDFQKIGVDPLNEKGNLHNKEDNKNSLTIARLLLDIVMFFCCEHSASWNCFFNCFQNRIHNSFWLLIYA